MSEVILSAITKKFDDVVAVDDVSLTVNDGETLGVVGPSGCGKTTTLRTIAGFESPDGGTVRFGERDVTNVAPDERNVGLLFQSYALFNNMTVLENVTFGPKMQGVGEGQRIDRARKLLSMLDISDLEDRHPAQLSGGQQQRVGLARALAPEPHILLLDEPMTGLDAKLKRQLRPELAALLDELDVTTLYVTHDQSEAMAMCDRIAVMNDGTLEQVGPPDEVYEQPANEFVAGFIGTTNLLSGSLTDGTLDLGFATLDFDHGGDGGQVTVVARPESFTLDGDLASGTVVDVFYLGEELEVVFELPTGKRITVKPDTGIGLSKGDTIDLGLRTEKIHILD
jgi:putative spermidine/putrescine transport system ATP-binding protein